MKVSRKKPDRLAGLRAIANEGENISFLHFLTLSPVFPCVFATDSELPRSAAGRSAAAFHRRRFGGYERRSRRMGRRAFNRRGTGLRRPGHAEETVARIMAAADAYAAGVPQHDDMTLVALRVSLPSGLGYDP